MPETPPLDQPLRQAVETLATQPKVLICLDFDGCVAELVADANAAAPVPANAAAIERLARLDENVHIAYVSGRPLEVLRDLASPPAGTLLVGSHGAEQDLGDGRGQLVLTDQQQTARVQVVDALEEIAAEHQLAWVEHKPTGAALHVRSVEDAQVAESLLAKARAAGDRIPGAHPKDGKQILECVVIEATKGEGIEMLRDHLGNPAVFFAGDDVTDEHGFAVLTNGDVSVKVGEGETQATHRIPFPAALAPVLDVFSAAREAA